MSLEARRIKQANLTDLYYNIQVNTAIYHASKPSFESPNTLPTMNTSIEDINDKQIAFFKKLHNEIYWSGLPFWLRAKALEAISTPDSQQTKINNLFQILEKQRESRLTPDLYRFIQYLKPRSSPTPDTCMDKQTIRQAQALGYVGGGFLLISLALLC